MTANIYYILWYIHHKLYIYDRYIYIYFNHTSFLLFQRDMQGGVSSLQKVTSAVSHCQLCSGVTEGVGDCH